MLSAYCNYDAQILPFLYIHLDAFVFVESACRSYDAQILAFLYIYLDAADMLTIALPTSAV